MVLDSAKLLELCYLYPSTATTLKYRSLDRRNYWLKQMQEQEIEYGVDRDRRTGLIPTRNKVKTIADEMVIDETVSDYTQIRLLKAETDGPGKKYKHLERLVEQARVAIKQVNRMKRFLAGFQKDLQDGSVKRVAPSKSKIESQMIQTEEDEDDAIYICLEDRDSDDSEYDQEEFDHQQVLYSINNKSEKAISEKLKLTPLS